MRVAVITDGDRAASRIVVIDRYKRVRALKLLARDTVRGTGWEIAEVEALLFERRLRCASEEESDQAWLLAELHERLSCKRWRNHVLPIVS